MCIAGVDLTGASAPASGGGGAAAAAATNVPLTPQQILDCTCIFCIHAHLCVYTLFVDTPFWLYTQTTSPHCYVSVRGRYRIRAASRHHATRVSGENSL